MWPRRFPLKLARPAPLSAPKSAPSRTTAPRCTSISRPPRRRVQKCSIPGTGEVTVPVDLATGVSRSMSDIDDELLALAGGDEDDDVEEGEA